MCFCGIKTVLFCYKLRMKRLKMLNFKIMTNVKLFSLKLVNKEKANNYHEQTI